MDKKTVFVKTSKGIGETTNQSDHLYGDAKRVLLLVDDDSTLADLAKRAPPSLRATLENVLQDLVDGGFIRDRKEPENVPQKAALKFATPKFATPKAAPPVPPPAPEKEPEQEVELDFSFIAATPTQPIPTKTSDVSPEVTKAKALAEAEAKTKQEAEAARAKAIQAAQIEAAAAAAKAAAYAEAKEKAKNEVEVRARAEAEARIKQEAEAARLKAEKEAAQVRAEMEAAKAKTELELRARAIAATRIKQEAEAARLKAEHEAAQARAELDAAKAKIEAEIRARVEAEAKAKQLAEAARLKAEREAEQARVELEAARVKAEAEAKARMESEARVKAEIEARIKLEAEEARLKAEREEAQARAKLAEAKAKADAEVRLRVEAEARIRAEVEARILQEEEEARLQAARVLIELDAVKTKAEADAKALVEAAARIKAEADARLKHDAEEARIKAEKKHADTQIDPADEIRKSFSNSLAAGKGKQGTGASNFKFDSFSLNGIGQAASATIPPHEAGHGSGGAQTPPGGGSKVTAATDHRAAKEAEAQRAKAEQEAARVKAEQQEAARIAAEKESARLKAEHEAYKAKVEQEEARAKVEQEARKQANEQGKAWEEAEQRAKAKAQAEKERLEKQLAEAHAKAPPKPPKARRKPLPIGKIFAGLLLLISLAVVVLPYFWPLEGYVTALEQELSTQLHQPVHVGKISAALLPSPKLELHTVAVGSARELEVKNLTVNFDFSAIFSPTKSINKLQLSEVTLNGQSLIAAMSWLQAAGGIEKYPVAHMELLGVNVKSDEIKVPLVNGHADFDTQGHFSKAEMKSEDGKFGIELESVQKHLQVVVSFHETTLPMLSNVPFNDLSATGEIVNGEIVFSDLYGHLYGGMLGGNARLNWQNGWLMQGRLIAKSLELQTLFPQFGISGELYADVNVTLSGAKLAQMGDAPRMEGTFEAKKVVVNKMDMETIARFGNRPDLARGHTNFDEIKGALQADNQGKHLRQLNISSGVLSGSGQMDVTANQQLSGKLAVELKAQAGATVPLILSGTLTEPVVKTR